MFDIFYSQGNLSALIIKKSYLLDRVGTDNQISRQYLRIDTIFPESQHKKDTIFPDRLVQRSIIFQTNDTV